jgi:hypothetical protein
VVGSSGSQGTYGHERVIAIDDSYAPRMRRALRAHGLRSGELRRLGVGHFVLVVALIAVWTRESGPLVTAWTALVVGLPYGLLVWAAVVLYAVHRWTRHFARELAPGRMLGLTVGPHSVRVRDHDSASEYAYATIRSVEVRDGVALIRPGSGLWVVPLELFEPVDLGVLQARAGRPGVEQVLLD